MSMISIPAKGEEQGEKRIGWKSGILTIGSQGTPISKETFNCLVLLEAANYQSQYKITPEAEMIPTNSD